jgi:hypothetical protein
MKLLSKKALVVAIIASITFSMAFLPTLACVDYVSRKIPPIVSRIGSYVTSAVKT